MIRVACPGCGAKLNAKDELLGQVRKCPKCGGAVRISLVVPPEAPGAAAPPAADPQIHGASEQGLDKQDLPDRLTRQHHYLICDKAHLVAAWENNGQGWMLKTSHGLVSATRNYEQLPTQGDFRLIELKLDMTGDGLRLSGLTTYQLAQRWALTTLDKGDHQIMSKVTGPGALNKDQKHVVRHTIQDQFMRHVWENAENVLEFLANTDYHSQGVG